MAYIFNKASRINTAKKNHSNSLYSTAKHIALPMINKLIIARKRLEELSHSFSLKEKLITLY